MILTRELSALLLLAMLLAYTGRAGRWLEDIRKITSLRGTRRAHVHVMHQVHVVIVQVVILVEVVDGAPVLPALGRGRHGLRVLCDERNLIGGAVRTLPLVALLRLGPRDVLRRLGGAARVVRVGRVGRRHWPQRHLDGLVQRRGARPTVLRRPRRRVRRRLRRVLVVAQQIDHLLGRRLDDLVRRRHDVDDGCRLLVAQVNQRGGVILGGLGLLRLLLLLRGVVEGHAHEDLVARLVNGLLCVR